MATKPKARFPIETLVRRLESSRTHKAQGGVAFDNSVYKDLAAVLITSLDWSDAIPSSQRESVILKAACSAGRKSKITAKSFLKEIHSLEAAERRKPKNRYMTVSTLSIRWGDYLRPVSLRGVHFSFHPTIPKRVDRQAIQRNIDAPDLGPAHPAGYTVVCARISARSPEEAILQTLTVFDSLRGIWNYLINIRLIDRYNFGGSRWRPINAVRPGPVHTVHGIDGKLAANLWWTEPYFFEGDVADLARDWAKMSKSSGWFLRRSRHLPYDATEIWSRYTRALDRDDHEASFLRLWSLLELLTGTTGERYDETIKRTLFVCGDLELSRLILEHLRDCRNALVHRDESRSQVEHHVFQLKRYVEGLIRLHLAWAGKFRTLAEVGEFLSLPADPALLSAKRKLVSRGLMYRRQNAISER